MLRLVIMVFSDRRDRHVGVRWIRVVVIHCSRVTGVGIAPGLLFVDVGVLHCGLEYIA